VFKKGTDRQIDGFGSALNIQKYFSLTFDKVSYNRIINAIRILNVISTATVEHALE